MNLFAEEQRNQLLENGKSENREKDHYPVIKLFMEDAPARWLLTELSTDEPDMAFGLCDLGLGFPELGYVSVTELESIGGQLGMPVILDAYFKALYPISVYARAARLVQEITEDERLLSLAMEDAAEDASTPKPKGPQP